MADVVTAEKRSLMMSAIRAKDTRPEKVVRRLLHRAGFRFRLHKTDLPGKPDLVLKRWNAIIHVHGCFWHSHDCHLFRLPATDPEKWARKLQSNRTRDAAVAAELDRLNWRQLTVWECALKGRNKLTESDLSDALGSWLRSEMPRGEISGAGSSN